jgi:hypothetical protein
MSVYPQKFNKRETAVAANAAEVATDAATIAAVAEAAILADAAEAAAIVTAEATATGLASAAEAAAIAAAAVAAVAAHINVVKVSIAFDDLVDGEDLSVGPELPSGSIVAKCYGRVTSAFTGDGDGTSTIALGFNTNSDVQSATAISGAPWSSTGMKAYKDGAAANMIVLTAARRLKARLAILATDTELASGVVDIYIEYITPA